MAKCKDCAHQDVCRFCFERYEMIDMKIDCHHFRDERDYEEVVRCKNCKYHDDGYCILHDICCKDNDFCSDCERVEK